MRAFLFVAGLVAGVSGLLAAQNLGLIRPRRGVERPPAAVAEGAERAAESAAPADDEAIERLKSQLARDLKDPQGKNLDPLAVLLEEATFEKDWARVRAAAEAVRAHGAEWVAPPIAPPPGPQEERSVFDLEREVERRRYELGLAARNNRATAALRRKDPGALQAWLDLLRDTAAPVLERGDAAWLIARSGDERAVGELVRALSDGADFWTRRAAGDALAREGYLGGLRELARILATSAEAGTRETAAASLCGYPAVRAGDAPESQAIVEALRNDAAPRVRETVAHALRAADLARAPAYVEALAGAVERDPDKTVRLAAAQCLEEVMTRRTGPLPGVVRAFERALRAEQDAQVAHTLVGTLQSYGDAASLAAIDQFASTPTGQALQREVGPAREELRARLSGAR